MGVAADNTKFDKYRHLLIKLTNAAGGCFVIRVTGLKVEPRKYASMKQSVTQARQTMAMPNMIYGVTK